MGMDSQMFSFRRKKKTKMSLTYWLMAEIRLWAVFISCTDFVE